MKKTLVMGLAAASTGMLLLCGCGKSADKAAARVAPAMEVEVVTIQRITPEWKQTYPARVDGMRHAEVRPRVSGILVKRLYTEGSFVKEGEVLFQIDPVPFEIAVEKAKADLLSAQAQANKAVRDFERVEKLFKTGAMSDKQHDDAISTNELAKAGVLSAQALLRQAELNLDYSSVKAPISGVTDKEEFTEGSLVSSADKLTAITQLDPVYVQFSLPEGDPAYQQLFAKGSRQKEGSTAMTLFTRNGEVYGSSGQVNFSESGVDPATGAVSMRAEFSNTEGKLMPGQFARIAFKGLNLMPCAIIPEDAVLMTAQAPIVYVVDGKNTVQPRPVALGPVVKEGQIIMGGLNDGDRVIITSLIRIRPGVPVVPKTKGQDAPSAGQAAAK
jgi:membrane fusion protein (multidrug efflux system)